VSRQLGAGHELAAVAAVEQYPVLGAAQRPGHGTLPSVHAAAVTDISPRVFKEASSML